MTHDAEIGAAISLLSLQKNHIPTDEPDCINGSVEEDKMVFLNNQRKKRKNVLGTLSLLLPWFSRKVRNTDGGELLKILLNENHQLSDKRNNILTVAKWLLRISPLMKDGFHNARLTAKAATDELGNYSKLAYRFITNAPCDEASFCDRSDVFLSTEEVQKPLENILKKKCFDSLSMACDMKTEGSNAVQFAVKKCKDVAIQWGAEGS